MIDISRLKLMPTNVRLEASTICQLRCPLCPTWRIGKIRIGRGLLKFNDFKKFIDVNPFVKSIELSNYGEIFLNPDLGEMIKYAYTKKIELTANNGVNLNDISEKMCEVLVKYQFKSFTCSIDGASQWVYAKYQKGGNFNRVIRNIKIINKYKELYHSYFPHLNWQFVIFGHNEHEIEKARKIAQGLKMTFVPRMSFDSSFSPVRNEGLVKKAIGKDVILSKYDSHKYTVCTQLWNIPQINWDGKFLGCCVNFWGDYGNVFQSGFEEVFNNERMIYARKMLLGLAGEKEGIPCSSCHMYKQFKNKRDFLAPLDIERLVNPSP